MLPAFLPELFRDWQAIDPAPIRPLSLSHASVKAIVMDRAKWDHKLVADLDAKAESLGKLNMMGMAGRPLADQTK